MSRRILSLFANIGVAEAYLQELSNVRVVVANELLKRRAELYQKIYPETEMVCGDITDEGTYQKVLQKSKKAKVDTVMATPPCQGMSTAGRKIKFDERNSLVMYAIRFIHDLKPKYALIENVTDFIITPIIYHGKETMLPDVIHSELGEYYDKFKLITNDGYTEQFRMQVEQPHKKLTLKNEKNMI